jgi:hypothetical protein
MPFLVCNKEKEKIELCKNARNQRRLKMILTDQKRIIVLNIIYYGIKKNMSRNSWRYPKNYENTDSIKQKAMRKG